MSKIANPTKVITGVNTRRSYANVWDPKSINGAAPKYSVSLIIPKSDTVTVNKIKAAIQAAYEEGESKLKGTAISIDFSLLTEVIESTSLQFESIRRRSKSHDEVFIRIALMELNHHNSFYIFYSHHRKCDSLGSKSLTNTGSTLKDNVWSCVTI